MFLVFGMLALILEYKRQLWFTASLHLRGPINHRPRPLPAPQTLLPENVRDESCGMVKEKLRQRGVVMNCRWLQSTGTQTSLLSQTLSSALFFFFVFAVYFSQHLSLVRFLGVSKWLILLKSRENTKHDIYGYDVIITLSFFFVCVCFYSLFSHIFFCKIVLLTQFLLLSEMCLDIKL